MCQPVSGPKFTLKKPRKMWKAVRNQKRRNVSEGPYYTTKFRLDGWAFSQKPRREDNHTQGGYHVFATKKGADAYAKSWVELSVIPVLVRGQVLPFTYTYGWESDGKQYIGYAVQSWRRA